MLFTASFAGAATHIVKSGDNMYRIALNYGVSLSQLQSANPGVNAHSMRIGLKLNIPQRSGSSLAKSPSSTRVTGTYTIAAGDTLSSIARRQGTSVASLQAANPSLNPNAMPVGKKINLTGSRSSSIVRQPAPKAAVAKAPVTQNPAPRPQSIASMPTPKPTPRPAQAEIDELVQRQPRMETQPAPAPGIAKNDSQVLPSPTPTPAANSESSTPATPPSAIGSTPTPVLNSTTQAAPPIPDKATETAPKQTTNYRLVKTTRELTLDEVAKEYGTTTDKLISLNGWQVNNFSGQTLLAVDSELYVPAQP